MAELGARDVAALKGGAWFGQLPAALQQLVIDRSAVRSFRRGEYIIHEGDPPRAMYGVLEGRIRATRMAGEGRESLMHVGEVGLWFGESAVLARAPAIASIFADTRVRVVALSAREFERIVRDEPRYFRDFAGLVMERYSEIFRWAAEMQSLDAEERLRVRLAHVAGRLRMDDPDRTSGTINVSQAELATMIGVSRQTLSALLARLEKRGLVRIGFRSIEVL
jgi:CRP/FNR family cyclic AMP-dependent transcriptional regulator